MAFDDDISQRAEVLVEAAKALETAKNKQARAVLLDCASLLIHWMAPEVPEKKADLVPFKKPEKGQ